MDALYHHLTSIICVLLLFFLPLLLTYQIPVLTHFPILFLLALLMVLLIPLDYIQIHIHLVFLFSKTRIPASSSVSCLARSCGGSPAAAIADSFPLTERRLHKVTFRLNSSC
jgi:hypothetical protein